jgi:hypothetical protein
LVPDDPVLAGFIVQVNDAIIEPAEVFDVLVSNRPKASCVLSLR